jgi:hypothetical protein
MSRSARSQYVLWEERERFAIVDFSHAGTPTLPRATTDALACTRSAGWERDMEARQFFGVWWLPDDPDRRLGGDLTFSPSGMQLELSGTFFDLAPGLMSLLEHRGFENYPVILGSTRDGKRLTLIGNQGVGFRAGPGVPTQRIQPSQAFVGAHISDDTSLIWTKAKVSFQHLLEWFGATGINEEVTGKDGRFEQYRISYSYPESLSASLDGTKVELLPGFEVSGEGFGTRRLEGYVHFSITVDEPISYNALEQTFVAPLQDLLTLGTGARCPINYVSVFSKDIVYSSTGEPMEIEVLTPSSRAGLSTDSNLLPAQMVFTASTLRGRFQDAVVGWFESRRKLDAAASVLFGSEYVSLGTVETEFLTMAQATEVFHRVRFPGTDMPPEEHAARLAGIIDGAPEDVRVWLGNKLRYTNDLTLRRRLRELYEYAEAAIAPITSGKQTFAALVVAARNGLVHEGTLPDDISFEKLFRTTQALRFLLRACFLLELRFSASEASEILGRNAAYNFTRSLPADQKP